MIMIKDVLDNGLDALDIDQKTTLHGVVTHI